MKKVIKTYICQLPQDIQDDIRIQLAGYELTPEQIEDTMDSKISDVVGNPECPIYIPGYSDPVESATICGSATIPKGMTRFYRLDEYGEYEYADYEDELQQELDRYDLTFEGYAIAKDKYWDILADEGYDMLYICRDNTGDTGLYYHYSGAFIQVTPMEVARVIRMHR